MKVKFKKLIPKAQAPKFAHKGDAGADLFATSYIYDAEQDKAGQPLAVELQPIKNFYSAEEYHQKYLEKNPDGYCHIPDKYYHMEKTYEDKGTYEDVLQRLDSKIKE